MLKNVLFLGKPYKLILTHHARERMKQRNIALAEVLKVLKKGKKVEKVKTGKFWVYLELENRNDNYICLSISVEDPCLIVVTTLVNWSPNL